MVWYHQHHPAPIAQVSVFIYDIYNRYQIHFFGRLQLIVIQRTDLCYSTLTYSIITHKNIQKKEEKPDCIPVCIVFGFRLNASEKQISFEKYNDYIEVLILPKHKLTY